MALAATLQDGFQDNSRNTSLWTPGYFEVASAGATVAESGQTVNISLLGGTGGDQYNGFLSVNAYDVTASEYVVRLVTAPNTAAASAEAVFAAYNDATNAMVFVIAGGTIIARQILGGTKSTLVSATYSTTTHAWLRLRESGGSFLFDTAPSSASNPPVSGDWTNFAAQGGAPLAYTAMKACIAGGTWSSASSPGNAVWDGFNASTTSTVGDTGGGAGSPTVRRLALGAF